MPHNNVSIHTDPSLHFTLGQLNPVHISHTMSLISALLLSSILLQKWTELLDECLKLFEDENAVTSAGGSCRLVHGSSGRWCLGASRSGRGVPVACESSVCTSAGDGEWRRRNSTSGRLEGEFSCGLTPHGVREMCAWSRYNSLSMQLSRALSRDSHAPV
jgi:hypothetical protein